MGKKHIFLVMGLVFFLVSASATTPSEPVPTENPGELVRQLDADLATARTNQVDVLAPGLFDGAESAFMKAKQALDKGARLSAISGYIAEGNASLKRPKRSPRSHAQFSVKQTRPGTRRSKQEPTG